MQIHYLFHPRGLSPEDGLPLKGLWINETRIKGGEMVDVDLPEKMLGTEVEDKASGFKGIVVGLIYHINGCCHATVQSKGVVKSTGQPIAPIDFDIRQLKGKAVPQIPEKKIEESKKERPSPMPVTGHMHQLVR